MDFRSGCRRQINLVEIPPISAILIISLDNDFTICGNRKVIRASPYPPNLRRMAARIIDPATGASTWAFGSHR